MHSSCLVALEPLESPSLFKTKKNQNEKERRLDQQVEDFMNFPREHPREFIENEGVLDLYKAGLVTDDELYPEVVDEIHKMMNED